MAKPRSIDGLVAALRAELEEARGNGATFLVALWQEADGTGGYLLRMDGAMMGIGDYQYGFTHLDDLGAPHSDEVARYARQEAGRLIGHLEEFDEEHRNTVRHTLPMLFFHDADDVEAALASGKLSIEAALMLWWEADGRQVNRGSFSPHQRLTLSRDVDVVRLTPTEDGFTWTPETLFRAGEAVNGAVIGERAWMEVPGGTLAIPAADVVAEPLPTRHLKP